MIVGEGAEGTVGALGGPLEEARERFGSWRRLRGKFLVLFSSPPWIACMLVLAASEILGGI